MWKMSGIRFGDQRSFVLEYKTNVCYMKTIELMCNINRGSMGQNK